MTEEELKKEALLAAKGPRRSREEHEPRSSVRPEVKAAIDRYEESKRMMEGINKCRQ